jgi:hypothetical protein
MYQFLFLADDRGLSDSQKHECADDLEALDKAHEFCALHTVEAWRDRRLVFTVKRWDRPSIATDEVSG